MPTTEPIITLTSDFSLTDAYVAQMKAAILRGHPSGRLIDITHQIPRHDILCASIVLERAVAAFGPGTIHLTVVDPGVGSARRILIVQANGRKIVCPDNGLITWVWRRTPNMKAWELTWRPKTSSATFEGRDIMAPAAAKIAAGCPIEAIARPIGDPVLLPITPAKSLSEGGQIIHIDCFGNATTNIAQELLTNSKNRTVIVSRHRLGGIHDTYSDVLPGKPLALVGSNGMLEIAVREGSAQKVLKLRVGDKVVVR
jgi:S-adenosyl-L-methionine hydrolase (adenosine-forming)